MNLSFDFSSSTKNVYVKKYNQSSQNEYFSKGCKIQEVDDCIVCHFMQHIHIICKLF